MTAPPSPLAVPRRRPRPPRNAPSGAALLALTAALAVVAPGAAQELAHDRSAEWLVATAVLAAPEEHRGGAEVRARDAAGELVVLREGTNHLICLADEPGDGFRAACYHESLEPFMARGRELQAEGVTGNERQERRWAEAEAGELVMPAQAAMVYNLGFPEEDIDPATADPATGGRLHAVYMPGATPESTGLPTQPGPEPWLMFPGTPSAHVMIAIPPRSGEGGGGA